MNPSWSFWYSVITWHGSCFLHSYAWTREFWTWKAKMHVVLQLHWLFVGGGCLKVCCWGRCELSFTLTMCFNESVIINRPQIFSTSVIVFFWLIFLLCLSYNKHCGRNRLFLSFHLYHSLLLLRHNNQINLMFRPKQQHCHAVLMFSCCLPCQPVIHLRVKENGCKKIPQLLGRKIRLIEMGHDDCYGKNQDG